MDPITLIITALVAGAAAGAKDTASQAIKDAYGSLKALIRGKFAGKQEAEMALVRHEEKPGVWAAPLREALVESGAGQDEAIIAAAQKVMARVDPQQAATGKYNVQIAGNLQGFVQGDNAHVQMTFGSDERG